MSTPDRSPPPPPPLPPPPPPEFEVEDLDDDFDDEPPSGGSGGMLVLWIVLGVIGMVFVGGILLAIVGPSLWQMHYSSTPEAARVHMANFGQAIDNYRLVNRKLPDSLAVLAEPGEGGVPPYIDSIPDDPWGTPYEYEVVDRNTYRIRSAGGDCVFDTGDDVVWPPPDR